MFYNVENFYSPQGGEIISLPVKWDSRRYENKRMKIQRVIDHVSHYKRVPMIIGFAEIQSATVLQDLISNNETLKNYQSYYQASSDERGMNVGVIYDKTRVRLVESRIVNEPLPDCRNIMYHCFDCAGELLHLVILHLPSQLMGNVKKIKRKNLLSSLREFIEKSNFGLKIDNVIVMGDFNENPFDDSVRMFMSDSDNKFEMKNISNELYTNNQFSSFHGKKGNLFDQFIVSEALLDEKCGFSVQSSSVYHAKEFSRKVKKQDIPYRTFIGTRYLGGYSDHYPILIELKKN